jgi:hypothetical protein
MNIRAARTNSTPDDLAIVKRDLKFGRDKSLPRWWHSDDPGRTAFFNALSASFPLGEKFFMTAVRYYRDQAAEPLRRQIDDFIYQEAMHSREHFLFNRQAEDAGYVIDKLEDRVRKTLAFAKRRSPVQQLAVTCALEHYTAALAQHALANPKALGGASDEAKHLWHWHAIEEIEHKAVAFDTYLLATRDISGFRRWLKRSVVMMISTARFHYVLARNIANLLQQDGRNDWATWKALLIFLYDKDGLMRHLARSIFRYFKPSYHPWQEDDRPLLNKALAQLQTYQQMKGIA